jgi:outer membrane protein
MKKIITPLLLLALLSVSMISFSQSPLKVGHVNIDEIMDALPAKDSAQAVLEKEKKEIESTYEEMTVVYNKLYDDYQKSLPGISDVVKKAKEDELLDKQKRINEFEQNASATLQNRNLELIKPIYDRIMKAIEKVADENKFTYILDLSKGSVVYTSKESSDINQLVLKILKP